MPHKHLTALARTVSVLFDRLDALGFDRAELLDEVGLSEEGLRDPDARIPMQKVTNVWRAVSRRSPGRPLGLILGSSASSRDLGLVGYTMHYSESLRRALQRLVRYSHILAELLEIELRSEREVERIVLENEPEAIALRHPVDLRLSSVLALARELTGNEITPLKVRFAYAEPEDTSEHRRLFRCPLVFGGKGAGLLFRRADLDLPVLHGDETLTGYLEQLAEGVLKSRRETRSLTEEVERVIWSRLSGGQPTVERVATVLGLSARTLQRRLRDEGRPFTAILEAVRRRMSSRLLASRELAVCEVAFLLGYREPRTFHRAFRRWYGVAPGEYRQRVQPAPAASPA